jgi:hypothetical protein
MVGWQTNKNWNEFGMKRSWPDRGTTPAFPWRNWEKPRQLQLGQPLFRPRFESIAVRTRVKNVTAESAGSVTNRSDNFFFIGRCNPCKQQHEVYQPSSWVMRFRRENCIQQSRVCKPRVVLHIQHGRSYDLGQLSGLIIWMVFHSASRKIVGWQYKMHIPWGLPYTSFWINCHCPSFVIV